MIVVKVGGSLYDHPHLGPGLRTYLAGEHCELWGYGDSRGDRQLLAMADRAYRVTKRVWRAPVQDGC